MYRVDAVKILCRLILKLAFFLALLCCISCTTYRTIGVEILEPAIHTLEKERVLGFWDRNIRHASDTSFVLNQYTGISDDELSYSFYTALQTAFYDNQEDSLPFILGKNRVYLSVDTLPLPVTEKILKEIGLNLGMDYIVALEKIGYIVNAAERKVECDLLVRLYDCNKGLMLDSVFYKNDIMEGISNEGIDVGYINELIIGNGIEYAHRLRPYWKSVKRRIYNGEKVLKMGDFFFLQNDYEQARKLWEAVTQRSPKQAIRGYLNLAWLYEEEGNFLMAKQMLQKGLELVRETEVNNADVNYLREYMNTIIKRIKDCSILENQL
ncbi:DUF6340 family protein [Odoribacter lunatus]|uniref:DUF6340 family protein n=1 Tax=Odoribacter lunatus TaxID=2941335 RepID=UPI00203DB0A4|nr:DUF6340 family protein [Odoribacter lunatus]